MKIQKRRSDRSGRAPLSSPTTVLGGNSGRLGEWDAALEAGVPPAVGTRWFRKAGGYHPRCLDNRPSRSRAGISRSWSRRKSRFFARRATQYGKSLAGSGGQRRRSHGSCAQCRHSKRRSRVSRDDSAMACRASRSPAKAGEACDQHGIASLCGGTTGWHRRRSERGSCARPSRVLERPSTWTAEGSAVGKRLEPGADRPPAPGRLPGR